MARKIDVLFVLPSLRSGGAERVMSFLAQNIDKRIFNAHLLITGSKKDQKYQVEHIPVTFLNKSRVKNALPGLIRHLFQHKPQIVVSAIGHLNTAIGLTAFLYPRIKFVARATTIPGFSIDKTIEHKKKKRILYRLAMNSLDKIICQSDDMKKALIDNHGISASKILVINNPVTSKFKLKKRPFANKNFIKFITIGRLTKSKGYERIIRVLAKLDKPFHYTIIGSGDHKTEIIKTISSLSLNDQITMIPYTSRVNEYLAENDIYLQGSFVEGFPNALLESCATGTPAVVFDAPGGINEIIVSGVNGYIAQNPDDFMKKLEKSINQDWDPITVRDSVYSRYSEEKILANYEAFFQELVSSKRHLQNTDNKESK